MALNELNVPEIDDPNELDKVLSEEGEEVVEDKDSKSSKDEVNEITSSEELEDAIQSKEDDGDDKPEDEKTGDKKDKSSDEYEDGDIAKQLNVKEEKSDNDLPNPKDYKNSLEYVNARFDLKLNLEEAKEITKEEEAEVLGDLIEKQTIGFNKIIGQYERVSELLKDEEIAAFVKAKNEGKSLSEFVSEKGFTTESLDDEAVVRANIKKQFPKWEKDKIDKVIDGYRDKELLDSMASEIREREKELNEQTEAQKIEQEKEQLKQAELQRQQDVQAFRNYTQGVKSVYGIPVTDEMRNQVFLASTQVDEDNLTYLDKALNTDQGVYLAALGIMYLPKLLKAAGGTEGNKKAKRLVEKIFDSPEKLQSGSKTDKPTEDELAQAANRF